MQNLKPKKTQEICFVHTPRTPKTKNFQNNSVVSFQEKQSELKYSQWTYQDGVPSTETLKDYQKQGQEIKENEVTDKLEDQDAVNQLQVLKGMEKTLEESANNMTSMDLSFQKFDLNIRKSPGYSLHTSAKDTSERISIQNNDSEVITASDAFVKASDNHQHNPSEVESLSPLLDILSTSRKIGSSIAKTTIINDKQPESLLFDKTSPPSEKFSKSKVLWSQSPYISHSLNSDFSSHDTEAELNCLTNLQSLRTHHSIYKLAYDESITDQSEADSRSPSPVNPETQVPKSIINDEILIHEADSCSDAGSEDVELIPHRYESETFLNKSKHMYVNKLSLAVELLRTQESLPYDEQFKRVSRESNFNETNPIDVGKVNLGFVEEPSSFDGLKTDNHIPGTSLTDISSQSLTRNNSKNCAAISSFSLEDTSCEEATEVVVDVANTRDNSEGVRAGYRRFQVQFRHYLTPRVELVNARLCCVIM